MRWISGAAAEVRGSCPTAQRDGEAQVGVAIAQKAKGADVTIDGGGGPRLPQRGVRDFEVSVGVEGGNLALGGYVEEGWV